jgi:hypothetical protein
MEVLGRFQLELPKYLHLTPEGLDAQSILLSLPPFSVVRRNIAELQLEFDKASKLRESYAPSEWLHLDVRLFLDPFKTLSTRKSKTVAMAKATVLNHLTSMLNGIEHIRAVAISDISLKGLLHVILNHHVVPTRGDIRKKKVYPIVNLPEDDIIDVKF